MHPEFLYLASVPCPQLLDLNGRDLLETPECIVPRDHKAFELLPMMVLHVFLLKYDIMISEYVFQVLHAERLFDPGLGLLPNVGDLA